MNIAWKQNFWHSKRRQLGLVMETAERRPGHAIWYAVQNGGQHVGHMTNGAWSPRAQSMIGFALVSAELVPGAKVEVLRGSVCDAATLVELPFF